MKLAVFGAADGVRACAVPEMKDNELPGTPGLADNHQVLAPSALLDGERVRIWYLAASRSGALAVAYREAPVDEIAAR